MKDFIFLIRRFDPERDTEPRWEEYRLRMEPDERVLDGLIRIKEEQDGSLTFRRSCAHGICGSCAMKINGRNRLACQSLMMSMPERVEIEPLQSFRLIKDLVVDMEPFFEKNDQVMPYLINHEPPPERERLQSQEEQQRILQSITCIMCGCCTSSCPVYWYHKEYLGPSALLKAARFIFDTRDRAAEDRLERITGSNGIWRCHSIYNCVEVCPKEIDITAHITRLKRHAFSRRLLGRK